MSEQKTKKCTVCGKEKLLEDFSKDSKTKDKLRYDCKSCNNNSKKIYDKKNPKGRLLRGARTRAKAEKIPFNLTTDDIPEIPDFCPVLNIPLRQSNGHVSDNSPTLDRIMPAFGYIRGNVCVISNKANRIKTNATLLELKSVVKWYESILNSITEIIRK